MKYTDRFFKFPVIKYDAISLANAFLEEEQEEEVQKKITTIQAPDFAIGVMALPYEEFKRNKVAWTESCKKGDTADEVKRGGFQETVIFSINYGDFLCSWDRKKFEEKLNEFMEKISKLENLS